MIESLTEASGKRETNQILPADLINRIITEDDIFSPNEFVDRYMRTLKAPSPLAPPLVDLGDARSYFKGLVADDEWYRLHQGKYVATVGTEIARLNYELNEEFQSVYEEYTGREILVRRVVRGRINHEGHRETTEGRQ